MLMIHVVTLLNATFIKLISKKNSVLLYVACGLHVQLRLFNDKYSMLRIFPKNNIGIYDFVD